MADVTSDPVLQPDLPFAVHDGVELLGDLCLPPGPGPFPALVLIHGGGWQRSSRRYWTEWGPWLAAHGYATFATSYRLAAPGRPAFMESVWDCQAAIQYLRGRAVDLRLDPNRIGALGASAGGHLAALLTLTARVERFANPYSADPFRHVATGLKVTVPIYGVFDMLAQWEHDQVSRPDDSMVGNYLGGSPADVRERYYESAPIYHCSRANAAGTRWLLAWGTHDPVVDARTQSEAFLVHLKRAGAALLRVVPVMAGHFWVQDQSPADPGSDAAFFGQRLLPFLRNNL